MSNTTNTATVINQPKLVMYTISTGGDQGEETLAPIFNENFAIIKFIDMIVENWGDDMIAHTGDINGKLKLRRLLNETIKFKDTDGDGKQIYIHNCSQILPLDIQGVLSSDWWWLTKHIVDLPTNLKVV